MAFSASAQTAEPNLALALQIIQSHRFVDLTHAFEPGIPHFSGFPNSERELLYGHHASAGGTMGAGFMAERFSHVGQWGTHVDPPVHFHAGLKSVDEIPVKEMILPLVVLDIAPKVESNPDYMVTLQDLQDHEEKFGRIPDGAFVALRSGWSLRWPDSDKMDNMDEAKVKHFPGWSIEVLEELLERRATTAVGHETTDTDPGIKVSAGNFEAETFVLGKNKWQIELLDALEKVPERGAIVVASFPKPMRGSGFPARVFAIIPNVGEL